MEVSHMQHDFILLDRSGSMGTRWVEAVNSVNAYVHKLAEDKVDTGVTLIVFDHVNGKMDFHILRDRIIPSTWHDVSPKEVEPRGGTPLNQALCKIVELAMAGDYTRVATVIMTDGEENQSAREFTRETAKAALDRCRAKGWQVIFLGIEFDNWQQGHGYGNFAGSTFSAAGGQMVNSTRGMASKRADYGATGATMSWTDDEKAELAKKK
jgi:uncharacterized protein YegL